MFARFFRKPVQDAPVEVKEKKQRIMSTDDILPQHARAKIETAWDSIFNRPEVKHTVKSCAMDGNLKYSQYAQGIVPEQQVAWYSGQSFIGYQLCAILSQQWLVSKCCLTPAEDAVRNGYDITVNDGNDMPPEIRDAIRKYDVDFRINRNLVQYIQMGRVFGIRIAMFKVESSDPDYYYKPFNLDGVEPGSYKGISQIDPYWITPQLSAEASGDPSAIDFYEPTWWNINGKLVHKSHLVIYIQEEVPDILKPSYIYGGVSIPQKIIERVYAAERVANEAPLLALTKRTDVINIDLAQATAKESSFAARIAQWVYNRDNYGVKVLGLDEKMQQFDTSLSELDAVIMTQFQLVAAAASIPSTKLLGTPPKGFNSTGEFDEAIYHEMLKSLQEKALTPLLNRHHELLIRSIICPEFNVAPFDVTIVWKSLDEMTGREKAELIKMKAEAGSTLILNGVIDPSEERDRLINDPESGYSGLISSKDLSNDDQTED